MPSMRFLESFALSALIVSSVRASGHDEPVACYGYGSSDPGVVAQSGPSPPSSSECWVDNVDFDSFEDGHKYSVDDARGDFVNIRGPYKMMDGGDTGDAITVVEEDSLRAFYPKGEISGKKTGFSFYADAPDVADDAWMSYSLRLSEDFDFTKGGKLPGLCGGPVDGPGRTCPVGCSNVEDEDGFSARLMWRAEGAIVSYLYYPDKPSSIRCGEDITWATKLVPGQWHDIRMRVKLNTVTSGGDVKDDGLIEAWMDGDQVLSAKGLTLRRNPEVMVSRTYMTTYVGGSSVKLFAPKHDQSALFKSIRSSAAPGTCVTGADSSDMDPVDEEPNPSSDDAPSKLFDFDLTSKGRGYDRPGFFSRVRVPSSDRDSTYDRLAYCRDECSDNTKCQAFTLYGESCYLKDAATVDRNPKWYGEGDSGWRWLYERRDEVVVQSAVPCGAEGLDCCYIEAAARNAPLCAKGTCAGEGTCVCTGGICASSDPCAGTPAGSVCAQSGPVECGMAGDECCTGSACGEDLICDEMDVCV